MTSHGVTVVGRGRESRSETVPAEPTGTGVTPGVRESRPIAVLLIDDDETWVRTQGRLLERYSDEFDVSTAVSLSDAQRRLGTEVPDCVVCDYQLGDGTGIDLLTRVRADTPSLPFILVTGEGTERVAIDAIDEEVTGYVRKATLGQQPTRLAERIERVVGVDRARRALSRERRSKQALLEMVTTNGSRADFGRQVCTHLVSEHGYACSWIGVLDERQSVVPLSTAGVTDYVEATVEPGTRPSASDAPAFAALRASKPVVRSLDQPDCETTGEDPDVTDWVSVATDHGFETVVALPITHESDCFGVLCVYTRRSERVDESALSLLEDYANTVGYVFRTTRWRETLLSSASTVVEFTLGDNSHPLAEVAGSLPTDATLCARSVVPRTETEVLYVTDIDSASSSDVRTAVTEAETIRSLDQYQMDEPLRRGLIVTSSSPERLLADTGTSFQRTLVTGRKAHITVRVGAGTTVKDCVETLRETGGHGSITTRWTLEDQSQSLLAGEDTRARLTDRQQQALELAIEGGYFRRPRLNNTGELAAALGVSRATYTQHLRAAQRKVLADRVVRRQLLQVDS